MKARPIVRQFIPTFGIFLLLKLTPVLASQPFRTGLQASIGQSSGPLNEARSALARGNTSEAIQILSDYLASHREDSTARILLGQAFSLAGLAGRAEQEFETVLQTAPENYIALAALGEIYEQAGRSDKAEPMLAHAAKASHGAPQIQLEWAVVLSRLHKYAEAQTALGSVLPPADRDERIEFYRLKASVALGLGNASAAAADMEKALALDPAHSGLAMATAAAELRSEHWQRAAALSAPLFTSTRDPQAGLILLEAQLGMHADFQPTLDALRVTPLSSSDESIFRQRLAELLITHGEYSAAIEELKRATELNPGRADLQFDLALAQYRAGLREDALASAEECKQLGDSAEVEDLLGDIQEDRGDNLAAVKGYQDAVALAPNEEKYRLSLAVEFIRHNSFDAAQVVLKQAEELQPRSWRIQLALGVVAHLAGTDEDATRHLLRAVEDASEPESALQYLGEIQMDRASPPDPTATARLCAISDRRPKDGHLQFLCGALLFRRDYASGDKTNAAEILRRLRVASRVLPKDAAPHCQLGRAYRWLEQWKQSLAESETCALLDPDSADAHYRLAQIYRRLGQMEQAQKEMKLYESASTRVADENARRDASMKTFLYTIQKETPDHK